MAGCEPDHVRLSSRENPGRVSGIRKSGQALFALVLTFLLSVDISLAADPGDPGWKPKVGNRMVLERPPALDRRYEDLLKKAHDAAERCDKKEFERLAREVKDLMARLQKPDLAVDNYVDALRTEMEVCQEELKFGDYIFQDHFDAVRAENIERVASKAARACDEQTYMDQIRLAEERARKYEKDAQQFREEAGEHRQSQQIDEAEEAELAERRASNSAFTWQLIADDLKRTKAERFKHCPPKEQAPPEEGRKGGFLLERSLKPGEEYASAPGASPSQPYTGFEFGLTPGGSFGSIGTRQATSFGGKTNGRDIHYDAANLHGDFRYYAGDLGGLGSFHPRLLVGLKGAGTFGGAEKGLEEDNHPPGGAIDSFVKYEIGGTLTPYAGVTLADWDCSRVNLLVGPRITFAEITGITDESGGGGVLEKFSRNVVQVGPAVGVELDIPISRASYGGFSGGVRLAGWGEYLPGVDVAGDSSTFPFDYRFKTKGAFLGTVRAGFFVRFGGFGGL